MPVNYEEHLPDGLSNLPDPQMDILRIAKDPGLLALQAPRVGGQHPTPIGGQNLTPIDSLLALLSHICLDTSIRS